MEGSRARSTLQGKIALHRGEKSAITVFGLFPKLILPNFFNKRCNSNANSPQLQRPGRPVIDGDARART